MDLSSLPIANIIPNQPELQKALASDRKLTVYLGIDPTATQIHLGHAVPLRILQAFAQAGHNVKFLIGDFTALIGDTSDKTSERPILTSEQIHTNFQSYKQQASKILDFTHIEVVNNSTWLQKLTFEDIVKLCQNFSTGDFVSRELIRERLNSGKHVGLHETLYPVMQGYDMYYMDADLQIGGTDQTYNMQAGRTLQKKLRNKESFVITTPFLTGTDGQKMSKTSGNAIWLTDAPQDIYGKVMSIRDELILEYFILATNLTPQQITQITGIADLPPVDQLQTTHLPQDKNPMDIKKILAHQITSELHNAQAADQAQAHFQSTVQQSQIPDDIPTFSPPDSPNPIDLLMQAQLSQSRGEARRLIEQGGFRLNGTQITDPNAPLQLKNDDIIQAGKRTYLKIKTNS